MQNLREKIANILRKLNTPLAYAIVSAVSGAALILLPAAALTILFAIIGAALLIFGAIGLTLECVERNGGIFHTLAIIKYALIIMAGGSMIFRGVYLLIPFSRILGAGLLLFTIVHLRSLYYNRGNGFIYYADTALTALLAVAGALLILTPHSHSIFAGAALLLLSIKLFFDIWRTRRKRSADKDNGTDGVYYVDDFVDKSNE